MGLFSWLETVAEERTKRITHRQSEKTSRTKLRQKERTARQEIKQPERTARTEARVAGDATVGDTIQAVAPAAFEAVGDVGAALAGAGAVEGLGDLLGGLFGDDDASPTTTAPSSGASSSSSSGTPDWLLPVGLGLGVGALLLAAGSKR